MKTNKRVLSALILSACAAFAAPPASAQLAHFSDVVVFGDSLSDAGYYRAFLASRGLPPALVATLGRFTTNPGPVWSELVSQYYGITPAPSNAGGSIYAQGGARVTLVPGITPTGLAERPVSVQITEYLASHGGAADPNALFAVWAIANDFFVNNAQLGAGAITPAQFQANILAAATAEVGQVARLFQAGARHVLAFGGFDPTFTPAVAGLDATTRAGLSALAVGTNTTFFSGLASLPAVRPIPVDLFTLFNEIRANPTPYGFANVTGIACAAFPGVTTTGNAQFCYSGNLVAPNADRTYLWADASGHLTTGGHALVAQFVESLIEGPTAYSILAETPLRTRAGHVRTLEEGLQSGSTNEVGRLTVFAAGDRGNFDLDPGANSKNSSGSLGLTARVSEAVTLGAAIGKTTSDGSFGNSMGGYKTSETVWSVFAATNWRGFYGTGIVSLSDISYTGVTRNIVLGSTVRTATSRPQGSNASVSLVAGYDFPIGMLRIGPTVGFVSQNVDVNEFDEAQAGSANLRIGAQKRRSEVWSAGVRASLALGRWTPWLRITADKERKDQGRVVTATPLSLATLNSYDVDAIALDTSYMTGAVGIRGLVTDRVGVSLAYFKVSGRSGIKEDGVTAMLSYRF